MMLTTRASRDSDADEFHDALEHLEEEEEEENEHVVAAKEDAATATVDTDEVDTDAAIGEDNKPSMLQSHASEEESSTSISHPAADEKASANPPQPPSREVTEESWQSARSVANSLHREGSTEERISLDTQPSVDLLGIASKSLFDALSGSGSEELENAELTHHTLWNTLDKSSAGIANIETQDSAEKQVQQSIDDDAKDTDDRTDSESNSDGSSSENDDAATNDDVEEGEQEQTGQLLAGGGTDDVQNHKPDAKNSEVNEDCRDTTGNTVSMEEEEERQVSINGVSKDKGEEQNQMDAAEGKVEEEEDVEEETTKATISTTESSSAGAQLEEKKAIIDESSEQVLEVVKGDEQELGDEPTPTPAKRGSETAAQEQVVTDGDYITPRKIDCGELCDMGSPLEALFLFCQGRRSGLDIDTTKEDIDIPLRTSSFTDADPRAPAPLSPADDHQHDYDSDSSDDSSIDSVVKFKMVNKDTDSIHDVRNIMRDIDDKGSSDAIDTQYSILPDRETLEYHQRLSAGPNEMNQMASHSFDESLSTLSHRSTLGSPTSARKKASEFKQKLKRGVVGLRSSKKHHRKRIVSSEELPGNAVYVRSSMAKTAQMRLKTSSSEESPTLNSADSSFNPMLLVKTIQAHDGPAWCAAFSNDGSFLATGGEDGNVTIWAVSPKSKKLHPKGVPTRGGENQNEDQNNEEEQAPPLSFVGLGPELATNLEIISSEPVQRYRDHTADVIDLSWSHTNFLLTASVDKSVRLYHFSKSNCLHLFKHANLVASVDFHPLDDRYFISGGLDKKLRLWNITDGRVKDWAQARK
ncbi:WD40 repeat domain-containing protein [Skeletonema marinoi]|uniref:WD40 repeat domain-containing protein n=1 Tax=Skeletonema marinoi TaxID=267567 RepID=A0AAD8YEU5_9STRA|nr:WD40 repeat domain-containing protein [Skeletonema marinoi]